MKQNELIRTSLADAFADLFDEGTIKIYTGSQPADPDSAVSGTLLCTINLPTPAFGAASIGVVSKNGVWSGTGVANGVAGYARMANSAGTRWVDLNVAESAAELIIDDENIVVDGVVVVSTFTYTAPDV